MHSSFLIGAPTSGCGKTTLSIGLLRALCDRGLTVQPFKTGPDYIDTQFHELAVGRPSINLDTFMSSSQHVQELFNSYGASADVSVIEGAMGLFDGYDGWRGSSADIAELLRVPVVLVVSARSVAYSVAPLIYGFSHFRDGVHIAGVVFNFVASSRQETMLRQACNDAGTVCLGCMPRNDALSIPSRHLGLDTSQKDDILRLIQLSAAQVADHIDIDRLLTLSSPQ